jgi:hypothetical protein
VLVSEIRPTAPTSTLLFHNIPIAVSEQKFFIALQTAVLPLLEIEPPITLAFVDSPYGIKHRSAFVDYESPTAARAVMELVNEERKLLIPDHTNAVIVCEHV